MCYIIICIKKFKSAFNLNVTILKEKGNEKMGTIVCQACNSTIDHFEDEKVTVLYSKCHCHNCQEPDEETK